MKTTLEQVLSILDSGKRVQIYLGKKHEKQTLVARGIPYMLYESLSKRTLESQVIYLGTIENESTFKIIIMI